MNKKNNANNQSKLDIIENSNKTNKKLSIKEATANLNFDASLSEIKNNKDFNYTGNNLNVSYLSIINKKDKDNNFSGTTKNDEYRSTDNVSTKSKKKKLVKVFSDSGNYDMDKTLKYDLIKNVNDNQNDSIVCKNKDKISNYISMKLVNKISVDSDSKDSLEFFETESKGLGYSNNCESFLQWRIS